MGVESGAVLFMLLGLQNPAGRTPDDNSDPAPPLSTSGGVPPAASEMIARLRPKEAPLATLTVGEGKEFQRITDAVSMARNYQAARGGGRVDIVIDPGEYFDESPAIGIHNMGLYSASSQPRSVHMKAGWEYAAAPFYIEGIIADAKGLAAPKYGIHAGVSNAAAVLVGSKLVHSANRIGSSWPLGTDGGSGGYFLAYDTHFEGGEGSRTNQHQSVSVPTAPFKQVYVNCVSNAGLDFNSMGHAIADELWVIDCQAPWAALHRNAGGGVFMVSGSELGAPRIPNVSDVTGDSRDWPLPDGSTALGGGSA